MGLFLFYKCLFYLILFGVLCRNHQIKALDEYSVNTDKKLNNEDDIRDSGVDAANNRKTLDNLKSDLNWVPPDLNEREKIDWPNTLPNKDPKELLLINVWKNHENSGDDKNILKRSSDKKYFKENKSDRKHPDLRKHNKEKQKKPYKNNVQKGREKFKNVKGSVKKVSKKTKRTNDVIENKEEIEKKKNEKSKKSQEKQDTFNDIYEDETEGDGDKSDDLDDSTQYVYADLIEIDDNDDNSQMGRAEKGCKKADDKEGNASVKEKREKSKSHKSDKVKNNKGSTSDKKITAESKVQHEISSNLNKFNKQNNGKSSLSDDEDDNQQDNEAFYSDWTINRNHKVFSSINKDRYNNENRKHKVDKSENNDLVKEKELKMANWKSRLHTDFDNSTIELKKEIKSDELPNNADNFKAESKVSDKNDFSKKEKLEESDYYDDNNVNSGDQPSKKVDSASKKDKSDHFLGEVSKFPVYYNNYDNLYITDEKLLNHLRNKESNKGRRTEVMQYLKKKDLDIQRLNNDIIKFSKSSIKKFPKIKELDRNSLVPAMMTKTKEHEKYNLVPMFNHVKSVYKLDPIAGKLQLKNISEIIKKRSIGDMEVLNDGRNLICSLNGDSEESLDNNENIRNNNMVNMFGHRNEMDSLYKYDENYPSSRFHRNLNKNYSRRNQDNNKKESIEDKFKQGWENLKSKVLVKHEKSTNSNKGVNDTMTSSEPHESVSYCSASMSEVPVNEPTEPYNSSKNTKPKPNEDNQNSDSNKITDEKNSDINDFLTGDLSNRIYKEILSRLQKSKKMIKDLGIGSNVQNLSNGRCIPTIKDKELIGLDEINKSMSKFNSMFATGSAMSEKCYAVPPEMESFLKYLLSAKRKSSAQRYLDFPISDGLFIFDAHFIKDMCPGDCKSEVNVANVTAENSENSDTLIENKSVIDNENVNNSITKGKLQNTDADYREGMNDQFDDKHIYNEPYLSKPVEHDLPKSYSVKIPNSDYIAHDSKLDSFEFTDEQMAETKEANTRNKKALSMSSKNYLFKNKGKHNSGKQNTFSNSFMYDENFENKEENMQIDKYANAGTILKKQKLLNEKFNEREIPKGINPDLLDIEKVKKFKGKYDTILYADTPHFEIPGIRRNERLKNDYEDEGNNLDDGENSDEDGFESAHMENAPREYYDV